MILAIKTDQPTAELSLYDNEQMVDSYCWEAGRELSVELLDKIQQLLLSNNLKLQNLKAVIAFEGPGSFTGLRIGLTVANTVAYSINVPIEVAGGSDWASKAISKINVNSNKSYSVSKAPKYGASANITKPRK